ncbi:MAG: translation elongation factor Ts [Holosporaceae bacterium]|jgi:elongation factor Ts|nr:translation elongation factor Ts [Holosporaceae bacterium]
MTDITAADVKVLRDRTGAGMMDCKKAMIACQGNIEDAIDWLRKKGLSAAAQKAGRVAAEGVIGICVQGKVGAMVEVNAETDFVARNELFQKYVNNVVEIANSCDCNIEQLKKHDYPGTQRSVEEELTNLIAVVGENIGIRRLERLSVDNGVVVSYVHNKIATNLGRIGILVALESSGDSEKLLDLGKKLAMHIAAANPLSISTEDLDPAVLERERAVVSEQARNMGKPPEFIEKIVEGRIRKFYEDVVLLEQVFVIDGSVKVRELIANVSGEIESPIQVTKFAKFVLGEGIEKHMTDFASEVAAQLG